MKEQDKSYMEGHRHDPDPTEEVFGEFKSLLALLVVIVALVMLVFAIWGRP